MIKIIALGLAVILGFSGLLISSSESFADTIDTNKYTHEESKKGNNYFKRTEVKRKR